MYELQGRQKNSLCGAFNTLALAQCAGTRADSADLVIQLIQLPQECNHTREDHDQTHHYGACSCIRSTHLHKALLLISGMSHFDPEFLRNEVSCHGIPAAEKMNQGLPVPPALLLLFSLGAVPVLAALLMAEETATGLAPF